MADRIKLTEDDFEEDYDADRWTTQITMIFDSEEEQKQFKKQILDDQEKAEKLDFYLHEVCYCNTATGKKENCLCHCHKLEQENKQLKDSNEILSNQFESKQIEILEQSGMIREYKQKLDEVQKYLDAQDVPHYGYPWHIAITKILKEKE